MIFKILLALSVHVSPIFLLKFVDIKICRMQARKELSLFQGICTTEKKIEPVMFKVCRKFRQQGR